MAIKINEPVYLGDGVYAMYDGVNAHIWISNGVVSSLRIVLEAEVFKALYELVRWDPNFQVSDNNGDYR